MNARLFQYAVSRDADVLAVVERNRLGRKQIHSQACKFSQAHGDDHLGGYYSNWFGRTHRIFAIASRTKPTTGQWKKGSGGYGWAPYAKNPLSKTMAALRFEDEPTPGLPELLVGPASGGKITMMTPQPFLWAGAAWVGLSVLPFQPAEESDRNHGEKFGPQWDEILASEWHVAREAAIDAEKKRP